MGGGFYKVNNEVLKLDIKKHKDEILFNHYLMQKENLQRLKGGLPKGQFYLTIRNASEDLEITFAKAQRIIKKFEKLGIIDLVKLGGKDKTPSIYSYNSIFKTDTVGDTVSDTVSDTVKLSIINCLNKVNDTVGDTVSDTHSDTSKKEILKRNIKNNNISKDIYVSTNVDLVIEKWNSLNLSKIVNIKGNRLKMLNARIKEYEIGGILTAIENIEKSNFLKGQNNKNWIITFDWFIRPNNFIKVLEGNYSNRKEKPQYEANRVLERVYE